MEYNIHYLSRSSDGIYTIFIFGDHDVARWLRKKSTYSYPYLMQHPQTLRTEMDRCQTNETPVQNTNYCEVVMFAAENMFSILKQMQDDPEKFGERLLMIEEAVTKSEIALNAAQKTLDAWKQQEVTHAKLKEAQEQVNQLQKTYDDLNDEANVWLAVVGMNTPG